VCGFWRIRRKNTHTLGIIWESSMLAFLGGGDNHGNCCKQQQCSTDAPHCAIRKRYAAIILPLSTNKMQFRVYEKSLRKTAILCTSGSGIK